MNRLTITVVVALAAFVIGAPPASGADIVVDASFVGGSRSKTLTAEQIRLKIDDQPFTQFTIEDDCDASRPRPASYLFYFDQPHMSAAYRASFIQQAGELISKLLRDGGQIMLVSNSRTLETFSPFSSEEDALLTALDALKTDPEHQASSRSPSRAGERDLTVKHSLDRLSLTLERFDGTPTPRVVLYAAEHLPMLTTATREGQRANLSLSALVGDACGLDVRVYAMGSTGRPLETLAGNTGGRVARASADNAAIMLREDLRCLYRLHIDTRELDLRSPKVMRIDLRGVTGKLRARRWLTRESVAAKEHTRILARFDDRGEMPPGEPIEVHVIPTGQHEDGLFAALFQIVAPGALVPGDGWHIAGSLLTNAGTRQDVSSDFPRTPSDIPLVLEREVVLSPGNYEGVAVAHNASTNETYSHLASEVWPDPDIEKTTVGPIVVIQESAGRFLRDAQTRTSGSVAQPRYRPLRVDRPTALMGIVCGTEAQRGTLRVVRQLQGRDAKTFPDVTLDLRAQRCSLLRDLIPPGSLEPGFFRYEVFVFDGTRQVARGMRVFSATGPES